MSDDRNLSPEAAESENQLPVEDLKSQVVDSKSAEAVKGGAGDFSFGVENPTTIGSATGGAGAGKIKFN